MEKASSRSLLPLCPCCGWSLLEGATSTPSPSVTPPVCSSVSSLNSVRTCIPLGGLKVVPGRYSGGHGLSCLPLASPAGARCQEAIEEPAGRGKRGDILTSEGHGQRPDHQIAVVIGAPGRRPVPSRDEAMLVPGAGVAHEQALDNAVDELNILGRVQRVLVRVVNWPRSAGGTKKPASGSGVVIAHSSHGVLPANWLVSPRPSPPTAR